MNVPPLLRTGVPRRIVGGGFLGAALLAFGGVGSGAVPWRKDAVAGLLHLEWMHENDVVRTLATIVVLAGVVLLALSWWQLRLLLDRISTRAVLVITAIWTLPLLVSPPLFSRDVYAYAGQGHVLLNGLDPYTYGPGDYEPTGKWSAGVDDVWRSSASPYGPVWVSLSALVVRAVDNHLVSAVILLRLLCVAGLCLVAWALPRLAAAHDVPATWALWLGLANPFVLLHGVGGAHNDALMVGLMVAGLAVAGRHPTLQRLIAATVLITVAALVKLPAIAALGFLPMLVPGWGRRLWLGVVVGATAALTAVTITVAAGLAWGDQLIGPAGTHTHLGWGWVHTLDTGSARPSIFSPVTGLAVLIGNGLDLLGVVDTPSTVIERVLAAGLGIGGLLALVLLLRAHHVGALRALGYALVAVVVLAPIVQPWYLIWGLVLLAAVADERLRIALGAVSIVMCLALLPNGRSLIRPPLYGTPMLAAVVLAVITARRTTRRVLEQTELEDLTQPETIPA